MRQYFMGFFSALCLSASFYFFADANHDNSGNDEKDQVILISGDGKTIIEGGSMRFFNKEGKEIVYIGVSKKMAGKIQLQNRSGYKIASMGAWYGDGFSGNGYIDVSDAYGQYGWSVIGKVSPGHYQ